MAVTRVLPSTHTTRQGLVLAGSQQEGRKGQGRRTGTAVQGAGAMPSWDSQDSPSLMGHTAPAHLSAKLGTMLASVFMTWYINETGNLFPQ